MPDTAIGPTCKALTRLPKHRNSPEYPITANRSSNPQDGLDEKAVVLGRDPDVGGFAGQHSLNASVLVIAQNLPGIVKTPSI